MQRTKVFFCSTTCFSLRLGEDLSSIQKWIISTVASTGKTLQQNILDVWK